MKLNGWQRLWVVVCIIYFVPALFIALSETDEVWQSYKKQIESTYDAKFLSYLVIGKRGNQNRLEPNKRKVFDCLFASGDIKIDEVNENNSKPWEGYREIETNSIFYESNCFPPASIVDFITKRFKDYWHYWLIILFPPLILYLLGWLAGWVIRGFRQ